MQGYIIRGIGLLSGISPKFLRRIVHTNRIFIIFMRKIINALAGDQVKVLGIVAGISKGLKMEINLKGEKSYWMGTYEPVMQDLFEKIIRQGMCVYDIGAHVGFFTLAFSKLVGPAGHVVAFEPLWDNNQRLQRNIKLNGIPNIDVIPLAVTCSAGKHSFIEGGTSFTGKLLEDCETKSMRVSLENNYQGVSSVNTISIDEFVYKWGKLKPDLIKIDVEGHEFAVLQGMVKLLQDSKPFIVLECHSKELCNKVSTFLQNRSYQERILNVDQFRVESCHLFYKPI